MSSIVSTNVLTTFNFQPVNTTGGTNTNYTVPTGRYARVIVTLDNYSAASGSGQTAISDGNKCITVELWLKSGDVLSYSNTTPSSSGYFGSATSTTYITVNGTIVSRIISVCSWSNASSNFGYSSGASNVSWFSTEYSNA